MWSAGISLVDLIPCVIVMPWMNLMGIEKRPKNNTIVKTAVDTKQWILFAPQQNESFLKQLLCVLFHIAAANFVKLSPRTFTEIWGCRNLVLQCSVSLPWMHCINCIVVWFWVAYSVSCCPGRDWALLCGLHAGNTDQHVSTRNGRWTHHEERRQKNNEGNNVLSHIP